MMHLIRKPMLSSQALAPDPLRNVYKLILYDNNIIKYQFRAGVAGVAGVSDPCDSCDSSSKLIFHDVIIIKN